MTMLISRHARRRIATGPLGMLALVVATGACATGPGRQAREGAPQLTCPLQRVGLAKNLTGRPVDLYRSRRVAEGQRAKPSELLQSLSPGQTAEFVLADSVVLHWQDSTDPRREYGVSDVHRIAAMGEVEVTYLCRGLDEGPPSR